LTEDKNRRERYGVVWWADLPLNKSKKHYGSDNRSQPAFACGGIVGKIRRWRERGSDAKYGRTRVMEQLRELLGP